MKKTRKGVLILCSILILVLMLLIGGLQFLESTVFLKEELPQEVHSSKTITRGNKSYFPRQDITTILVLGVDQTGPVRDSGSYRNDGESDLVVLMIFDEKNETYSVLALNRDSMLEMPVLGLGGKRAGSYYGQLALSHTYGSGLEDSCENTRQTVSDLLYGINIDYYVSLNMDAIGLVNDAVGGVKVLIEDDFTDVDPSLVMGTEVTLNAEQARSFVQTRKDVGDQLNLSRMQRHRAYMKGFVESLNNKMEQSDSFVMNTYNAVSPYLVTDCSVNTLSSLAGKFSEYELQEIVSPEGDNVLTEAYYEFHLDEKKLDELILRLFYVEK